MKSAMKDKSEILIVEDSATQAERLAYILEKNGYIVFRAANGKEALAYLETKTPTMVISDIVMPEMDGFQLCMEIKKETRLMHLPVLLLTTLSEPEDVIRGLECGADNFMNKPYEESVLLSRIHYILLNRGLRKEMVGSEMSIDIMFNGKKQTITSHRIQILDLLLSTYDTAIQKNRELQKANRELRKANETIKSLGKIIPICAYCKKIRDDEGYWSQVEQYVSEHTEAKFSHGICPACLEREMKGIETSD